MILYVNGDSNSAGTEMQDPNDCYANNLAQLLGASCTNQSVAGASNDHILRTTYNYLAHNRPDLMVIGWSSSEREDWFVDGEYRSVNSFFVNTDNIEQTSEWDYWSKHKAGWISGDYSYEKQLVKYWNTKIFNFHLELIHLKIPHLFFNAIYSFNLFDPVFEYNWNNTFYKPYDKNLAMIKWADDQGYEQITPGQWHFEKDAHTHWANILYSYIKENHII
jgi:hypothetical protein